MDCRFVNEMFICTKQLRKSGNLLQDVCFKKKNSQARTENILNFNELAILLVKLFTFSKENNPLLGFI